MAAIIFVFFQATLTILDKLDIETENTTEEEVARKFGWEDDYHANELSLWQRVKPKIWSLFDEPHSSTFARVSYWRPTLEQIVSISTPSAIEANLCISSLWLSKKNCVYGGNKTSA